MKQMSKLLKLSLLGFLLSFIIALFIGTRGFNLYCAKVIVGDTSGLAFRWGIKESGWENCVLNTTTLNQVAFEFSLYVVLFLIHVYLISQQQERNIFKNIMLISLVSLGFIPLFYLTGLLFPQILYGFLEGGVSIIHGGLVPFFFSGFLIRSPHPFYFVSWSLEILSIYVALQAGPLIITLLLNRFHLSSGYKPGTKSFLYVLLGSILFELLVIVVFLIGFAEYNRFFYRPVQRTPIGPAPQIRYEVDPEGLQR